MADGRSGIADGSLPGGDGWTITIAGDDPAREGWAATITALSNGALGVRGSIEETAAATTFMAHAYEQAPIAYHERLHGFAERTDTRVPVAETLELTVRIDGADVDFTGATATTRRTLDLRRGTLSRDTHWIFGDGRRLTIRADRLVPLDGRALLIRRLAADSPDGAVTLHPRLAPAPRAARQSDDPRIGVDLGDAGFVTERAEEAIVIERLGGSGIAVAAVQRVRDEGDAIVVLTALAAGTGASDALLTEATALAERATADGFDAAAAAQAALLADYWDAADVAIDGDDRLTAALRLNLFHLFASAGRDGRSSAAAKGLTGEGYEGHYFWDAEAFMVPALAVLAPAVARAMLLYRAGTLDAAIANARALDHPRGALYAWRTIAGRECSAHYPSGSAQYHINADIAFGLRCYVEATGDEAFLIEHGARMLIETARLWLDLGDWAGGEFHLRGVTGPDEYTALVDDNWYTNRMAQRHLRYAAEVAALLPEICAAIGLDEQERAEFTRAADAMHLPYDAARDLDAQDASFLDKPRWDIPGTPRSHFPLLLHYHPMTLYRHQVAKQADLILALVLAGDDVPRDRKARAFAHYEPITTHDSTLSASAFAILAAEIGETEAALRFLHDTSFIDLEDRHGNTAHGVHMAALAGSWLALVWGFGGMRPGGTQLAFRPTRPAAWRGYRFGLRWRGTVLHVTIDGDAIDYRALAGPPIVLRHHDREIALAAGEHWTGPLAS